MTLASRQQRERDQAIRRALKEQGTVRRAAKELGLPKSSLHDRAKELGLEIPRKRRYRRRRRAR